MRISTAQLIKVNFLIAIAFIGMTAFAENMKITVKSKNESQFNIIKLNQSVLKLVQGVEKSKEDIELVFNSNTENSINIKDRVESESKLNSVEMLLVQDQLTIQNITTGKNVELPVRLTENGFVLSKETTEKIFQEKIQMILSSYNQRLNSMNLKMSTKVETSDMNCKGLNSNKIVCESEMTLDMEFSDQL